MRIDAAGPIITEAERGSSGDAWCQQDRCTDQSTKGQSCGHGEFEGGFCAGLISERCLRKQVHIQGSPSASAIVPAQANAIRDGGEVDLEGEAGKGSDAVQLITCRGGSDVASVACRRGSAVRRPTACQPFAGHRRQRYPRNQADKGRATKWLQRCPEPHRRAGLTRVSSTRSCCIPVRMQPSVSFVDVRPARRLAGNLSGCQPRLPVTCSSSVDGRAASFGRSVRP